MGSSSLAPAPRASSPVVWRGLPTDMWRSVAAFAGSPSLSSTSKKHAFLSCNKTMCDTGYPSPGAMKDMTLWYPPSERYAHCARGCLQERMRELLEWWNASLSKLPIELSVRLTEEALKRQEGPGYARELTLYVEELWIVDNYDDDDQVPSSPLLVRSLVLAKFDDMLEWSEWMRPSEDEDEKYLEPREVVSEMLKLRGQSPSELVSFAIATGTVHVLNPEGKRTAKLIREEPESIASVSLVNDAGETIVLPRGRFDPAYTDRLVYIIPYLLTPHTPTRE